MRRIALLLTVLLVTACGDDRDPLGPTTPLTYLPGDSTEVVPSESQLLVAKARWAGERNARDYSFVTWYLCFCDASVAVPVRVSVHGTQVVSVREVTSGRSRQATEYDTIEGLFDRAIEARGRDVPVRVTYGAGGYPAWLTIGTPENDAGVTYHVEGVRLE
jgi:Family of unknown function (DUF6174)